MRTLLLGGERGWAGGGGAGSSVNEPGNPRYVALAGTYL
jgi:hypothetical protein